MRFSHFITSCRPLILLVLLSIMIGGCGVLKWSEVYQSQPVVESPPSSSRKNHGSKTQKPKPTSVDTKVNAAPENKVAATVSKKSIPSSARRKEALLDIYTDWKGTPYRLGGNTKKGIDCSAFVQVAMADAFNVKVSRTTQTQQKEGKPVNKEQLETGDLVFFQTGNTTWHVGIYLQDGQFMHASVTYGVSVSDINNTYWKRRFKGARRVDIRS